MNVCLVIVNRVELCWLESQTLLVRQFAVTLIVEFTLTPDLRLVLLQPKLTLHKFFRWSCLHWLSRMTESPCNVVVKTLSVNCALFQVIYVNWRYLNSLHLDYVRKILELDEQVYGVAQQIYKEKSVLVMGRGYVSRKNNKKLLFKHF